MPRINTPTDLGAIIRERRRRQNLDQVTLAKNVGVSRQWIVEVKEGKPRAGIVPVEVGGVCLVGLPPPWLRAQAFGCCAL